MVFTISEGKGGFVIIEFWGHGGISVKPWSQYWLIAAGAYPGFCSMKRLGVFLLPLDGMLVHRRSLPCNLLGFPNNSLVPIYTPGWREALWELSVLPKNTTQCPPARTQTRTARMGVLTGLKIQRHGENSQLGIPSRKIRIVLDFCSSWINHERMTTEVDDNHQ